MMSSSQEQPSSSPRTPLSPFAFEKGGSPFVSCSHMERTRSLRNVVNLNLIGNQRTIRVFLSSAFGAMDAEREKFAEKYIPLLLLQCELLAVTLVIVDLRWEISDETKRDDRVMDTTMNAIMQCDVFIGLYGQRYGWHDKGLHRGKRDEGDILLASNFEYAASRGYGWVKEYRDRSITEVEYLAFAHHNPHAGPHLFLFRDPKYDEAKYDEAKDEDEKKRFTVESEWALAAKEEFQSAIKQSATSSSIVHYEQPEDAAEAAYEFLKKVITKRFGENPVNELFKARCQHEAFLSSRITVYIPNDELTHKVKLHAETCCSSSTATVPLVLVGERGSGKSSFLANWIVQYGRQHSEDLMIFHFIGASPESGEPSRILNRLIQELADLLNLDLTIPTDINSMKALLNNVLSRNVSRRIVLVIDALNQATDDFQDLSWLDASFPPKVAVILSTTPNPACEQIFEKRHWNVVHMPQFEKPQERELISRMLQIRGRFFPDTYIDRILAAEQCNSPLFLCVLLDELCTVGVFEKLETMLDYYLEAPEVVALFEKILERIENENTREYVARITTALYCARFGLSENELLDFLEIGQTVLSPYFFALRRFIVNRAGLLVFFHHQFNQAIQNRYLKSPEDLQNKHQRLASYFFKHINDERFAVRVAEELCYHLEQCGDMDGLRKALQNLNLFFALKRDCNFELMRLWKITGDSTSTIASYYEQYLMDASIPADRMAKIGSFLDDIGAYDQSITFYKRALQLGQNSSDEIHLDTVSTLNVLGMEFRKRKKLDDAIKFHNRALRILTTNPDDHKELQMVSTLMELGLDYFQKGEFQKSLKKFDEAYAALQPTSHGKSNLDVEILNHLAEVYIKLGDLPEALRCYEDASKTVETLVGTRHQDFAESLKNMAVVLQQQGNFAAAHKLTLRVLHVLEQCKGHDSLEVAEQLIKVADMCCLISKEYAAIQYLQRAVEIFEKEHGHDSLPVAETLARISEVAGMTEDPSLANECIRDFTKIYATILGSSHENNNNLHEEVAR